LSDSRDQISRLARKSAREGDIKMDLIRKLCVKAKERARAQTMAEYAMIVAAIVLVIIAGYETTGTTISTLVNNVDGNM
jgi:Flp pilus assembly pilin Flp